jgi:hypothetical protein
MYEMTGDEFLDEMGGEWLDGSGFEEEPEDAPEMSDDYIFGEGEADRA